MSWQHGALPLCQGRHLIEAPPYPCFQKKELRFKEALQSARGHTAQKVMEMAFKHSHDLNHDMLCYVSSKQSWALWFICHLWYPMSPVQVLAYVQKLSTCNPLSPPQIRSDLISEHWPLSWNTWKINLKINEWLKY